MAHRHVTGCVEHALVDEDAAGRGKVVERRGGYVHGITDT
jgi:hypothetical protein